MFAQGELGRPIVKMRSPLIALAETKIEMMISALLLNLATPNVSQYGLGLRGTS